MDDKKPEMLIEIVGQGSNPSPTLNEEMWVHHCPHNGRALIMKDQPCNWCGANEDGTTD